MSPLSAFLAALAAATGQPTLPAPAVDSGTMAEQDAAIATSSESIWQNLAQSFVPRAAAQVRIEQRIIWRVSPMPSTARDTASALMPLGPRSAPALVERKMDKCLPMSAIAGGQAQAGSRLILFLRDRRMVAANLERACSARDFYSGFYVDKPNADGRLCVDRDRILARSGARCEISSFRLLVADD